MTDEEHAFSDVELKVAQWLREQPKLTGPDLYQSYADEHGITRAEAKRELFHLAYSNPGLTMREID